MADSHYQFSILLIFMNNITSKNSKGCRKWVSIEMKEAMGGLLFMVEMCTFRFLYDHTISSIFVDI